MPTLQSAQPQPALRRHVRAYAQRRLTGTDPIVIEPVPAQLEQVLNFELGVLPGVRHRECAIASEVWIGGAQTSFPGHMHLSPGVESFAIFFQPAGWSEIFGVPMCEVTNRIYDATSVVGLCMTALWNRLGEASSFEKRVEVAETFLLNWPIHRTGQHRIVRAAMYLFHQHGTKSISSLSCRESLGLRQFERLFFQETGVTPKIFARVSRFQAALDAKLSNPRRTWLDIAHDFGYYDQMHMIHDFEYLGKNAPSRLIAQMGDVRPPALTVAQMEKHS